MRKSTLFFLMLLVLSVSAQPISEQEALQKAQKFLQGKNIVSRGSQGNIRRVAKAHPFKHLYLFNAENNGGFVIVSGDSRAREILAYSEEGNLDYSQMPENMKWWLSLYDESIASIRADMPAAQETAIRRASKADVAPMMNYSWSQYSPYNNHCPTNCCTGCVPLAIAQMLAYYRYPSTLPALSGYTDSNGHYLDALNARSINYSNLSTDDAAWLARYAGQAIRANYAQDNTISYSGWIPTIFVNQFGYGQGIQNVYRDAYNSSDWDDILYKELSSGRPFILSGQVGNDASNGHTFICHGYSQGYYAVNWGWGGSGNGYFAMSAMIGGGTDYTSGLSACIGIHPSGVSSNTGQLFSVIRMEAISGTQIYRNSSSSGFNNVRFAWRLRNSLMQEGQYELALAINKPDGSWDLLWKFDAMNVDPTMNLFAETVVDIGSQYSDGTYRITMLYKKPSDSSWYACQGLYWRYVEAVISGNTLTFTNYPQYDEPYPTGTHPDYPDPINPDNPDVPGPTKDLAFEYPMVNLEMKGKDIGFIVDWNALSTAMFGYLNMDETKFFDNFWVDCFAGDYEVSAADARYVTPYAYNYNYDGSYGVNNYDMMIFNLGDDIFGNNGKLPEPDEAEDVEPEYYYIGIASFYPNYKGEGKHFVTFEIPKDVLDYLLEGETSPVTVTRWIRFIAKTDDEGNSTAPFRYLWVKLSMQIRWGDGNPDGIRTIGADNADNVYYNLRGQRMTSPQKGIYILKGKKVVIK